MCNVYRIPWTMVHEKSLVIIPTRSHHYGKFCQISFRNYKVLFLNTGWYLTKSIIVPIHWWSPLQYVYLVQFGVYYLLLLWLCSDSQYQSVVPSEINLNFTGISNFLLDQKRFIRGHRASIFRLPMSSILLYLSSKYT